MTENNNEPEISEKVPDHIIKAVLHARKFRALLGKVNDVVDEGVDLSQVFSVAEINKENESINEEVNKSLPPLGLDGVEVGGKIKANDLKEEHLPHQEPTKIDSDVLSDTEKLEKYEEEDEKAEEKQEILKQASKLGYFPE